MRPIAARVVRAKNKRQSNRQSVLAHVCLSAERLYIDVIPRGSDRSFADVGQSLAETTMQDAHDPYAALRHRDYCLLLTSNVLAATAAEAQFAAVEWELFARTGLPEYLGYGGLAQFIPVLLFALPAGQAADRFNRKYLLMTAHAAMLAASVGLALVSYFEAPIWAIFAFL